MNECREHQDQAEAEANEEAELAKDRSGRKGAHKDEQACTQVDEGKHGGPKARVGVLPGDEPPQEIEPEVFKEREKEGEREEGGGGEREQRRGKENDGGGALANEAEVLKVERPKKGHDVDRKKEVHRSRDRALEGENGEDDCAGEQQAEHIAGTEKMAGVQFGVGGGCFGVSGEPGAQAIDPAEGEGNSADGKRIGCEESREDQRVKQDVLHAGDAGEIWPGAFGRGRKQAERIVGDRVVSGDGDLGIGREWQQRVNSGQQGDAGEQQGGGHKEEDGRRSGSGGEDGLAREGSRCVGHVGFSGRGMKRESGLRKG